MKMDSSNYTKWKLPRGAIARLGKGYIKAIAYCPDGARLAVASSIGIWVYDAHTYEELALFTEPIGSVESLTYSPDGDTIAIGSKNVRLWDASTGEYKATFIEHAGRIDGIVYSPDGRIIAAKVGHRRSIGRSFKYSVYLWDAATGKYISTLTQDLHGIYSFAYSPDSKTIATGTYKEVHLWDAATSEHKTTLTGHTGSIENIAYSPDGKIIVTSGGRFHKEVHLWDAATGGHKTMLTDGSGGVSVAYSPDGKTIAIADWSTVNLWDTEANVLKATLTKYNHSIEGISYSPDGKTIATKSDKEVYLWDAATGKQKATFIGHVGDIYSFSYSRDGKTIATGSDDGTVFLWETTSFISQYSDFNPQEIHGNWRAGWALDVHTLSSRPLPGGGYETARTELGESVYQLKYRHDTNKIQPIAEIAVEFLKGEFRVDGHPVVPHIKAILPIPLSPHENFQPVPEIATQMGQILGVPVPLDYLIKTKNTGRHNFESEESRREQLQGAFAVQTKNRQYRCVLLLDDIYNSGVTLTEATKVLQKHGGIPDVLVLTLTYTRTKR